MKVTDYYLTHMKLGCMICMREHNNFPIVYTDFKIYDRWDMEKHLRTEHTQDEIIKEMTEHHWDAMIPKLDNNLSKPKIKK